MASLGLERLSVLSGHFLTAPSSAIPQPGSQSTTPYVICTTSNSPVVIVGGIVLDVQARPGAVDIMRGGSVPGEVRQVPGGVGRNIAEAISRLIPDSQPAPLIVGLVGDDTAGTFLANSLRSLRLNLECLLTVPGVPTPCVSAVFDRTGEVAACVADVGSVEQHLTPGRLRECAQHIKQAPLLVAEANLPEHSLVEVCSTAAAARVPVFLEPVSVPKSTRLVSALHLATFVSPNAAELMAMADEVRRRQGLPLLPRPDLELDKDTGDTPDPHTPPLTSLQHAPHHTVSLQGSQPAGPSPSLPPSASPSLPPSLSTSLPSATPGVSWAAPPTSAHHHHHRPQQPQLPPSPEALLQALLRQLSAFAVVLLGAGTRYVVLTMGSLGAALITLPPDATHLTGGGAPVEGQAASTQGTAAAAGVASAAPAPAKPAGTTAIVCVSHLRALPAEVASVSGAGDTLVAGMVAALLQQRSPLEALAYGMAAAKQAVEALSNVPDVLDLGRLAQDASRALVTAKHYRFAACM